MTPDAHGYVKCYADDEVTLRRCLDTAVCSRLADVGTGTLDADTGGES